MLSPIVLFRLYYWWISKKSENIWIETSFEEAVVSNCKKAFPHEMAVFINTSCNGRWSGSKEGHRF